MADDSIDTKEPKTTASQAASALKRARKSAGPEFNENPAEVAYFLKQAEVLAMLAIAEGLGGNHADVTS